MKLKCITYNPNRSYRYAHLKRDGIWLEVQKSSDDGRVRCYTSLPTDVTSLVNHLPWYVNFLRRAGNGACLYGELWVPGQPASAVKSHMVRQSDELRFDAFASANGPDSQPLEEVQSLCFFLGVDFAPFLKLEPHRRDMGAGPAHGVFCNDYGDCEGVVMKDGNLLNWAKWKPVKTMDCFISGWVEGRGKYLGLVGALEVSVYNGTDEVCVANVSGMDDATREEISENVPLGKVVEVEYQYVGSGGRLRHPRFKRFRDDKRAEECTISQDPDMESYYGDKSC